MGECNEISHWSTYFALSNTSHEKCMGFPTIEFLENVERLERVSEKLSCIP
jgi:hypothetical protein